jgi:hypothetical protein
MGGFNNKGKKSVLDNGILYMMCGGFNLYFAKNSLSCFNENTKVPNGFQL